VINLTIQSANVTISEVAYESIIAIQQNIQKEEFTMSFVRSLALIVFCAGLLLTACGAPSTGGTTSGGVREFKVTATDFKYDPGDQTFKPGEKLRVTMTDKGAVDHTWVLLDASGAELTKLEVKVGATASKDFTAPATPGTYSIICDIAGHKEAGMQAKATVK
jgi:plastocyanin